MKKSSFLVKYEYLGNILIEISGKEATVISGLGVKRYEFAYLDGSVDNRYLILKIAQKTYFNEIIDGFDRISETKPVQKKATGFWSWFAAPEESKELALPNLEYKVDITSYIISNIDKFNWEDVGDIYEIKHSDDILKCLQVPQKCCFRGFSKEFFVDDLSLSIKEKEHDLIKVRGIEEDEDIAIRLYFRREIINILELKEIEKEFERLMNVQTVLKKSDLILFRETIECFQSLYLTMYYSYREYFDNLLSDELVQGRSLIKAIQGLNLVDASTGKIDKVFNIEILSQFFISNFHLFRRLGKFQERVGEILLRIKCINNSIVSVGLNKLTKQITDLKVTFCNFMKISNNHTTRSVYIKLSKFNTIMNRINEAEHQLGKKVHLYQNIAPNTSKHLKSQIEGNKLYASIRCDYSGYGVLSLYLFENILIITNHKYEVVENLELKDLEWSTFNSYTYIFTNLQNDNNIFSQIEKTNLRYLRLKMINREKTIEFVEMFHSLKYMSRLLHQTIKPIFYRIETDDLNSPSNILLNPVNDQRSTDGFSETEIEDNTIFNIDCISYGVSETMSYYNKESYDIFINKTAEVEECRCIFYDVQVNGIRYSRINEKSLYEIINSKIVENESKYILTDSFSQKCKQLLEDIDVSKFYQYNLSSSFEDDVSFIYKKSLLNRIFEEIKLKHTYNIHSDLFKTANHKINDEFLWENDILYSVKYEEVAKFKKIYLTLLRYSCETMPNLSQLYLYDLVVLFGMLLQRNIYLFYTPRDLGLIQKQIDDGRVNVDIVSQGSRPFLKSLLHVVKLIYTSSYSNAAEMLLRIIYKGQIDDKTRSIILSWV